MRFSHSHKQRTKWWGKRSALTHPPTRRKTTQLATWMIKMMMKSIFNFLFGLFFFGLLVAMKLELMTDL